MEIATGGYESVWDYPRPPRVERVHIRLRVVFERETIADTTSAYRILETSHPPTYYFPPPDVSHVALKPVQKTSFCEFKGVAEYLTLSIGDRVSLRTAWRYPAPGPAFSVLASFISFYPSRVDDCFVGAEKAVAQPGDFYGG